MKVIKVACSDCRRNQALGAEDSARDQAQIHTYFVREAGGALQYAGPLWIIAALRLLPLFDAGIRVIELENHRDCAGLAYHRRSRWTKIALYLRDIKGTEDHHQWVLARAAVRIERLARWTGHPSVTVTYRLVDVDQAYEVDEDAILHKHGFTAA
jgi:hypothetical protein